GQRGLRQCHDHRCRQENSHARLSLYAADPGKLCITAAHWRLWNVDPPSLCELRRTGHPPQCLQTRLRDPATRFCARVLLVCLPLLKRGRRECRVRAAPAVSCAENVHFGAHEHTGQRKHSDIPCATALRLTSCSPRWSGLVVTVTPEKLASHGLSASIAAPGPHDFAVRSRTIRLWTAASIASRAPRVVTMAIRPSGGHETMLLILLIFRNEKRNI